MSSETFNPQTHARRVFYYTLTTVILLAGVTFLAWGERNEANFARARAAAFQALANAKDMADVQAKFAYKKAYGGAVKMASPAVPTPVASTSGTATPGADASSSPGAASSASPGAASPEASPASSPGASPSAAQLNDQHAMLILERDRNDARLLAERFEAEAEREQSEAARFGVAQVVLMIAICMNALAGPTRQTSWCLAAMGLSLVAIAMVASSYVL